MEGDPGRMVVVVVVVVVVVLSGQHLGAKRARVVPLDPIRYPARLGAVTRSLDVLSVV